MIGRRAVVGLSLICALVLCAFAAPGASAAGTTAFTCVEKKEGDFSDAHCDDKVEPGKGTFGHVEIKAGEKTEFEGTNAKTSGKTNDAAPAMLTGVSGGVAVTIECKKVASTGTIENKEGPPMSVAGTKIVAEYSECTVQKPAKCKVKEPIKTNELTSATEINATEMFVKFTPPAGKPFVEITLEGAECAIKGTFPVEGSAAGTGASNSGEGATLVFTEPMTATTLKFGGQAATFSATETIKMKGGGNPIDATTTAT